MRRIKKLGFVVMCLLLLGLITAPRANLTRASGATPIAQEPAPATPSPAATVTPIPTETAAVPTAIVSPAKTAVAAKPATATKNPASAGVSAQSVSTGSLKIAAVDANGNPLSQSCVDFGVMSGRLLNTLCDSVPSTVGTSTDDGDPDGFIEIPNLEPGTWVLQGRDPLDASDPAPSLIGAVVTAGHATTARIVFHAYGKLNVTLHGADGAVVNSCDVLYLALDTINGSGGVYTNLGGRCDADDGASDGVVTYAQLPAGTYWVSPRTAADHDVMGDEKVVTIQNGQTVNVDSYVPSVQLNVKLVDSVTGKVVPNMRVELDETYDALHTQAIDVRTGAQAHTFTISPHATYALEIEADGSNGILEPYGPATYANVQATSPGQSLTVTVKLVKAANPTPTPTKTPTPTPTPKAAVRVSPTSLFVGDLLEIDTKYFPEHTTVTFLIDGHKMLTGNTDEFDNLGTSLYAPDLAEGSHTVTAQDGKASASATFMIAAAQSESATTIAAGKTVKVAVHGFRAKESVQVRLYALNSTTKYAVLGTIVTDANGQGSKTVTVSSSISAGSHKLVSYGKDTHAGDTVTIQKAAVKSLPATQTVSKTTVAAGGAVTITIHGFAAKEIVVVRLYGLNSNTKYIELGSVMTDANGSATATVVIPSTMSAGSHKLVSYGKKTHAGVSITVTAVHHDSPAGMRLSSPSPAIRRRF